MFNCRHVQIRCYRTRISDPIMDRIDIHMEVPPVHFKDLRSSETGDSS